MRELEITQPDRHIVVSETSNEVSFAARGPLGVFGPVGDSMQATPATRLTTTISRFAAARTGLFTMCSSELELPMYQAPG